MARNAYYQSSHWRSLRQSALTRDKYVCTVDGCRSRATHVDHIRTRPSWAGLATPYDTLANVRSLCAHHDAQLKERTNGKRGRDGKPIVKGCDVNGNPLDPNW